MCFWPVGGAVVCVAAAAAARARATGVWRRCPTQLLLLLHVHAGDTRAKTLDRYRNIGIMAHIDAGKVRVRSCGVACGGHCRRAAGGRASEPPIPHACSTSQVQ